MPADWYDENKGRATKDFNKASADDNKSSEQPPGEDKSEDKGSAMVKKDRPAPTLTPDKNMRQAADAESYNRRLRQEKENAKLPDSPDGSKLSYAEQERQKRDAAKNKTEQPGKTPGSYDSFYDEQKGRAKKDFNRAAQKGKPKT